MIDRTLIYAKGSAFAAKMIYSVSFAALAQLVERRFRKA